LSMAKIVFKKTRLLGNSWELCLYNHLSQF
jgi:hypothetical protein